MSFNVWTCQGRLVAMVFTLMFLQASIIIHPVGSSGHLNQEFMLEQNIFQWGCQGTALYILEYQEYCCLNVWKQIAFWGEMVPGENGVRLNREDFVQIHRRSCTHICIVHGSHAVPIACITWLSSCFHWFWLCTKQIRQSLVDCLESYTSVPSLVLRNRAAI